MLFASANLYPLIILGVAALILLLALAAGFLAGKRPEKELLTLEEADEFKQLETDEDDPEEPVEMPAASEESPIEIRDYPFAVLKTFSVTGRWRINLQCRADRNECRIGAPPELFRFIKVEEERSGLYIRYTGKKPAGPLTIDITSTGMPRQLKITGKSRIWIDRADAGGKFACKLADGGKLTLPGAKLDGLTLKAAGRCQAECDGEFREVDLELSGESKAEFAGSIRRLTARISGNSKAEAATVEKCEADISGGSKLKVEVTGELKGDLSGASTLKYSSLSTAPDIRISGNSKLKKQQESPAGDL